MSPMRIGAVGLRVLLTLLASACAERVVAPTDGAPRDGASCGSITDVPPPPQSLCAPEGRVACVGWALGLADGGWPRAVCVWRPPYCVHANQCADLDDPSSCRCGDGPACGPNQVCRAESHDGTPSCRCIVPP